jgi:hypothetical protein
MFFLKGYSDVEEKDHFERLVAIGDRGIRRAEAS